MLAGAVLAVAVSAGPVEAAFPGRDGLIVYEGSASPRGVLYLRKPDATPLRRLRTAVRPSAPSVSPLGRRIAFSSAGQIWIVYIDGTGLRQLTAGPVAARAPTWSPAGDALAFAGGRSDAQDIYRIEADGNSVRRLTFASADEEAPAWSSRDQLVFVRRSPRGDGDIFLMSALGGRSRRLTRGKANDADPDWSPDGRFVAFTRRRPGVHDVYVMRADGTKQRRLTRLRHGARSPAWSPDGRSIAFAARGPGGRRSLYVMGRDGRRLRRIGSSVSDPHSLDWQPSGFDPVIAAAGDIACDPVSTSFNAGLGTGRRCAQRATSDALLRMDLSAVLALGDLQYEDGQLAKFMQSFDPTWGRLKPLVRPVLGNHDYRVANADGYFDYFNGLGRAGGLAGTRGAGYYSFDLGRWHVVALNSQCSEPSPTAALSCAAGSPQERWLRADLAQHRRACTLAFWHHPLVSSGVPRVNAAVAPLWEALEDNGVEAVLVGHDHAYERFAPMDVTGVPDRERGVRQFVVGTGGKSLRRATLHAPNTQVRQQNAYGVLQLTLHPHGYSWTFVNAGDGRFRDSGSDECR